MLVTGEDIHRRLETLGQDSGSSFRRMLVDTLNEVDDCHLMPDCSTLPVRLTPHHTSLEKYFGLENISMCHSVGLGTNVILIDRLSEIV